MKFFHALCSTCPSTVLYSFNKHLLSTYYVPDPVWCNEKSDKRNKVVFLRILSMVRQLYLFRKKKICVYVFLRKVVAMYPGAGLELAILLKENP
jgi:hypothetical protein